MRHPRYTDLRPIMQSLSGLAPAPSYVAPVATLTPFPTTQYEVGQLVTHTLVRNWTQNSAGPLASNATVLSRNGVNLSFQNNLPQTNIINEAAAFGTTTYRNTVSYLAGPVLNNNIGFPDTRGQIQAGSVFIDRSYSGFYGYFYGAVSSVPSNLRTLPLSSLGVNNSIPGFFVNQNNIVIAIPDNKTLQSVVVVESNENITANFTMTTMSVNDAAGVPRGYKRYVATTVVPLNANLNTITLS